MICRVFSCNSKVCDKKHATSLVRSALESSLVFQIIYGWDGDSDPPDTSLLIPKGHMFVVQRAIINCLNFSITLIGSVHNPTSHFTTELARANIMISRNLHQNTFFHILIPHTCRVKD